MKISGVWLKEHLDNPDVVVVDCRFSLAETQLGKQQYLTNHIPGAYYLDLNLDLSSPITMHGGRHPLPDVNVLTQKFSQMGIDSSKTLVVAYDDSRLAFAARLWWLLRYLGHEKVGVLDGGLSGWLKEGYPVDDRIPPARPGNFIPMVQSQMVVGRDDVVSRKDLTDVVLIDSRESDRYQGIREPIDKIAGHIPGAINYPWQGVTDTEGYLLDNIHQAERWQDVVSAEEIIVYCGSGVTACVNLLSLDLAGIFTGKLYAGSWSDWISY
ncbi:sulfurtransferase [Calothrix sp. 336/3]|uniref:sulfurtransferase n=1 Tax=Calothrix sp. 336/3 TaxID=1337936 RepID=UPI0004E3A5DA|nr:sulfurtransferase [Calothrix sp. 336/3]AKG24593.1 3-mercaptopyruvate sulfurtransferase [Calothrix sp. 336/3]